MADIPTFADLFDAGEREALIRPTSFDATIIRTEGSDVNIAFNVAASMAQEVAIYAQAKANETFLATAEKTSDEALDRWSYDRYVLVRQGAQSSSVDLQFSRTDGSLGFTIESGSLFGTSDGVNFRILNDVVFPAGSLGPFQVLASCEQTGKRGNVAAGMITTKVTTLEDDSVSVTNPEHAAGGLEAETSGAFAARSREFFAQARRGTLSAIETGGTDTPGVDQATVLEVIDPTSLQPNFRVQMVIADADGQANAALAQLVRQRLVEYRALGVPVLVTAGAPEFVTIRVVGLQFRSTVNTTTVLDEARAAIVAVVNALPPGATLERAAIFAALKSVSGLIVPSTSIIEPVGDLVPLPGGVLRTTKDRIFLNEAA